MSTFLLAGGGTAGHVNPLLAVADKLREIDPSTRVLVLGTREGLESRLVPARGYELLTIDKLPFPRRIDRAAVRFLPRLRRSIRQVTEFIEERSVDAVVGFGGYASAPAYLAARRAHRPFAIHEANAKPGLANRLGSRFTPYVGVAFAGTPIRHGRLVGMPLRHEIETLDRGLARPGAIAHLHLHPTRPTVLVTGGSLGARRINTTIARSAQAMIDVGWQILHITGERDESADPGIEHYHVIPYCDRMELALAACDLAVSRAGSGTVSELSALGIPAVYVPYPVGNGEQAFNARGVVDAGGGILVDDAAFDPAWVTRSLLPLIRDQAQVASMGVSAASVGVLDGSARMVDLIREMLPKIE